MLYSHHNNTKSLSAGLSLDGDLRYEMTIIKVTLGFRFPFLGPVSGGRTPLDVVSLHQLTVVPLPLQSFSLPLVLLPVNAGSVVTHGQVCGLITGVEGGDWTVGLSLDG